MLHWWNGTLLPTLLNISLWRNWTGDDFVVPASHRSLSTSGWMSPSLKWQLIPGLFLAGQHKHTNTKCYLVRNSAHWGCAAGGKLQLSSHSPVRYMRSQVALGTGLPNACHASCVILGTLPWVYLCCLYWPSVLLLLRLTAPMGNIFASAHSLSLACKRWFYTPNAAESYLSVG